MTWQTFREEYKAEKGRYPGEFLPPTIYVNGKSIPVKWESAGQVTLDDGRTVEVYIPIVPANVLSPAMAEQIFDQVQTWDITDNKRVDLSYTKNIPLTTAEKALLSAKKPKELTPEETVLLAKGYRTEIHPARETLAKITSPQEVFGEIKFNSLRQELVNQGLDPSTLSIEGVDDFLLAQSSSQQGDRLDPAFLEGMGRILSEVQKSPQDTGNILRKYSPSVPQKEAQWGEKGTPEQIAKWGQQQFQGQQALQTFWGLPKMETFGTEKEYQQNVVNQLKAQAEEILASGYNPQELNPLSQAQGQVVGQYQASQKRLQELEVGASETWNPQIAQEQEQERQRLEAEQIAKQKPKKSAMDIEFERLLGQSRRPQRRTSL